MFQNPFSRIFDSQHYPMILAPGECCYSERCFNYSLTQTRLFYLSFFLFFIFNPQSNKSKAVAETSPSSLASIIQTEKGRPLCFIF